MSIAKKLQRKQKKILFHLLLILTCLYISRIVLQKPDNVVSDTCRVLVSELELLGFRVLHTDILEFGPRYTSPSRNSSTRAKTRVSCYSKKKSTPQFCSTKLKKLTCFPFISSRANKKSTLKLPSRAQTRATRYQSEYSVFRQFEIVEFEFAHLSYFHVS